MIRLLLWEGAPLAPMAHRWARTIVRKVNTSITLNFAILGLEGEGRWPRPSPLKYALFVFLKDLVDIAHRYFLFLDRHLSSSAPTLLFAQVNPKLIQTNH